MAVEYCTLEDLARLGLTPGALRTLSADDMTAVIASTSSLIDSYLKAGRYVLPLVAWGADIAEAAAAIAVWRLMKTRGYNPNDPAHESIRLDFEDKIAWLKMVSAGTVIPDVTQAPGTEEPPVAGLVAGARVVSSPQRGWYVDSTDVDGGGPFSGGRR
jgi:phage gp36-like protein